MTGKAIEELCRDPYAMRRRADRGLDTPCHRCLFYEPGVGRGCKAVRLKMKPREPRTVDPRRVAGEQAVIDWVLPTAEMSGGQDLSKETSTMDDHRADPIEDARGALICKQCGKPVRTANGGQHPVHART